MQYDPVATYLDEAADLLTAIEESSLRLNAVEQHEETINELFRAFHTIKGSGAMCGMDNVAGFTHHVETLLDGVRNGSLPVTEPLTGLVLAAKDHIHLLLKARQEGSTLPPDAGESLIASLNAYAGTATCDSPAVVVPERAWTIRFHPNPQLLALGGRPALLFRDLRELGPCEIVAHTEAVPPLESIEPDRCYLWWSAQLRSDCDENTIRDVFIFVEDGSRLEVELDGAETPAAMPAPAASVLAGPVLSGPILPGPVLVNPEPAAAHAETGAVATESTVRVPAGRLDRLVRLVGELVMNQSRLTQAATVAGAAELANPVQELDRLVGELRDEVLGIRMLPIGTLFGRFRRLVHDLSADLGKEADLATEGAETELDKSILDRLSDPLVHLLRNSLDHGIEPADERVAAGKPRRGTIRLAAIHTGANVVVSIHDDGRGIDLKAVRERAIERQLIAPDAVMSEKEILSLILLPGFSTARQVTAVSGRGVGMDVVKRHIEALRGSLSFGGEAGKGTRVSITLPLTLAIIDGLLVEVGADQFIIPMSAVSENVELLRAQRARNNGRNVIAVRGELIPYIDLRQTFGMASEAPPIEKVVIVRYEDQRVGMVVDRVLGTHQTVIQSLGKFFREIRVVSGATIMGDGRVALILDIAAAVQLVDEACRQSQSAA